jgi:undecaprenyl-phosphate galactose phosphotransferase
MTVSAPPDLAADMQVRGAETVILVPSPAEMSEIDRVIDALNLNLIAYTLIPPLQRLPFAGLKVQTMLNSDAIMMTSRTGLMSPVRQGSKRLFDVIVSVLLILMLLPVLLVIAGLVAWGGGPVLYGHKRIGRGNRPFHCLKFRTMAVDSDKILANLLATNPEVAREWRQNFKLENDPRITRIGRFLRKTSLDELPQLLNVIRGEMSLVGPRPVVADELRYYYGENAGYYHMVRPGITGLWQVSGRSQTTYDRRVFLDTCYVRNWNLWTDVAILFNTVPSVLGGNGAR